MNLTEQLSEFGISKDVMRPFGAGISPELVDYLDLIGGEGELRLDGAVEHDKRAVLYYINDSRLSQPPNARDQELSSLNRSLASRGERSYLAIVKPGILEVAPVRLGEQSQEWKEFRADSSESISFYANLVHGTYEVAEGFVDADPVFDEMFNLLLSGADTVAHKIGRGNVLSLVGRALFFRFLCDRKIVEDTDTPSICPHADSLRACFDNSENAYYTSRWLDKTFNGHFLPFSKKGTRKFFDDLNRSAKVFVNLSAIVRGLEPIGDGAYQHRFDWAVFDFAHVPVGLLSQVYEAFSWKWDPVNSEETSVHYTPRHIANTLVAEAFDALHDSANARVLDPACGAGVFLVLAFKRIYAEVWKSTGVQPNTRKIRAILEQQLCGFEISESALRLTALSLYLTAIELDPNPIPPRKLKFEDLNNLTLFNQREDADPEFGPVVGSVGAEPESCFEGKFDLVLCNPPWSKISEPKLVSALKKSSKTYIAKRDPSLAQKYSNPRGEPDLPFLWKATSWCRPDGHIAMVLPARILFRQSKASTVARETIFQLIRTTGIVNCSNVRKTNVWPGMDQPFMLYFAINAIPDRDSTFWFVSPQADSSLNRVGDFSVDASAVHVLEVEDVLQDPWLMKTLAVGTVLDRDVVQKIRNSAIVSLRDYWSKDKGLISRKGYVVKSRRDPSDASRMHGMPDVGNANDLPHRFRVISSQCKPFKLEELDETRIVDKDDEDPLQVYRGPIVLVKQALPRNREDGVAVYCANDIVYSQSFYGYSAKSHRNPHVAVGFLQLFAHSNLWRYYVLCTSPKVATERPVFLKGDFDESPIIPIEELDSNTHAKILSLHERLTDEDDSVFEDIDAFFGELYGLTSRDMQVIDDTLTVRNPLDELGARGSSAPTPEEIKLFVATLRSLLKPFSKKLGSKIDITLGEAVGSGAFRWLAVSTDQSPIENWTAVQRLILSLANRTGASLVIQKSQAGLLICILNQYRYWTQSRARILAADILRNYFALFEQQMQW